MRPALPTKVHEGKDSQKLRQWKMSEVTVQYFLGDDPVWSNQGRIRRPCYVRHAYRTRDLSGASDQRWSPSGLVGVVSQIWEICTCRENGRLCSALMTLWPPNTLESSLSSGCSFRWHRCHFLMMQVRALHLTQTCPECLGGMLSEFSTDPAGKCLMCTAWELLIQDSRNVCVRGAVVEMSSRVADCDSSVHAPLGWKGLTPSLQAGFP